MGIGMNNYNKIIDITFKTQNSKVVVNTPRTGIKPHIELSATMSRGTFAQDFEIRLTNFYSDDIANEITDVEVVAGYENSTKVAFKGKVNLVYTESPGPDKVTVIACSTADYETLTQAVINMKLAKGFMLKDAMKKISAALQFDTPQIDKSLETKTCAAPFSHNGKALDAITALKTAFPDISVTVSGNTLSVAPTEGKGTNPRIHDVVLLTQAPQYSGGTVNIIAPWNPDIKCGDYIHFPATFSKKTVAAIVTDVAQVNTIQLNFSTDDTNEMNVSGTCTSKLKEV